MVSISYLGLTREEEAAASTPSSWRDWYAFFPWEDRRAAAPAHDAAMREALTAWAHAAREPEVRRARAQRVAVGFGLDPFGWNEELVLQRYELLFEAGLIPEATGAKAVLPMGARMTGDHRRILATGIARLRAKIKYRPVVFELMAPTFTLYQLQRSVEALAGRRLHKQNFRRLIEQQDLVEETGALATDAARGSDTPFDPLPQRHPSVRFNYISRDRGYRPSHSSALSCFGRLLGSRESRT